MDRDERFELELFAALSEDDDVVAQTHGAVDLRSQGLHEHEIEFLSLPGMSLIDVDEGVHFDEEVEKLVRKPAA